MESEQNYPLTKRNNNLNNKKYDSKCKKELLRSSLQPNHEVEDCQEYSWFNNEQGKINQLWKDKNLEDTIFCCFLYPTLPPPSILPFVSYIISSPPPSHLCPTLSTPLHPPICILHYPLHHPIWNTPAPFSKMSSICIISQ